MMRLAQLLLVLQWRAGTVIQPMMVRTGLGHKIHCRARTEQNGKECGGQYISTYIVLAHNFSASKSIKMLTESCREPWYFAADKEVG
jgi:hypothetical protein